MLDRIPVHADGFRMADKESLDGEIVLFNPESRKILYSNHSGVLIWGLCDGGRVVGEIIQILSDAYPDAAGTMEADVVGVLTNFHLHGAIEWV